MEYSKKDIKLMASLYDTMGEEAVKHLDELIKENPKNEEAIKKFGEFIEKETTKQNMKDFLVGAGIGLGITLLAYGTYEFLKYRAEKKKFKKLKKEFEEISKQIDEAIGETENIEDYEEIKEES